MAKVALLTLHGMGETRADYATDLFRTIKDQLGDDWSHVTRHSAYYQGSLQQNQERVWQSIDLESKVHYDDLRRFLLFGFGDAAGLENRKSEADSVYVDAQIEIARNLFNAREALGGDGPVVVISQSLGCQVFSSYLYDAQKRAAGGIPVGIWQDIDLYAPRICGRALSAEEKAFLRGDLIQRWITTGCNIPIFVAAHKVMDIRPIAPPPANRDFQWLNLYDPDDVLGWPLQPLSTEYKNLVTDKAINAGHGAIDWIMKSWNPMSHTAYWTDDDVVDPLVAMLRKYL